MGSGASREGEEAGDHGSSPTTVQSSSPRDGARRRRGSRRHRAKKAAQVGLTKLGFSPSELCVDEGEEVLFHWGVGKGAGHNIRQVVVDDGKVLPVNGGFFSGEPTGSGSFKVRFSYSGVYSFISDSYGNQASSAFKLTVDPRPIKKVEIKECGFVEPEIHIREGTIIRFQWSSPTPDRPHTITEVKLCPKHFGWVRTDTGSFTPSQSGWYKHEFREPGIFYFLTEAEEGEARNHLCVVEVESGQRQHWIDVTDVRFNPRLLTIQEGERVWWSWDRFQCLKKHKIIQVELPSGHDVSNPFPRVVRGGFVSGPPSRRGMLSHVFDKPGVFYYCDNNYEDVREYLGVVVVKPKPKRHPIEVTADGFYPDLSVVSAGDKIVWTWDASQIQQSFSIMQVENCVVGSSKGNVSDDCSNKCDFLDEEHALQLTRLGMATTQLGSMGVYHFRVADTPTSMGCCSIIVNAAVKHHVINITKTGYEPHLLTVHPGDHVWWTWDRVHGQHNVVQVSREGESIPSGFCSGPPIDGPGAFYTCFDKEGVVYFHSAGLPKLYGAIMTVPTPKVHQVIASKNSLTPDPVTVKSGDCVAWVWPVLRKHKLIAVTSTQEVFELQKYTQDSVSPRRCCALQFTNPGVFHYYSKAFSNKTEKFMYEHSSKAVLSSVVVSVPKEETVVRVTRKGFSPNSINIKKGHTVVWTWKETNMEFHNISLVTPPNVDLQPVSIIPTSKGGFTSGPTEALGSYSHCWDAAGTYHVMSEGAKNELGVVHILDSDAVTRTPVPSDNDSGTVVQRGHRIDLTAGQEEVTIYYTLDGSIPEPNGPSTRILKPEQGIVLKRSGLHIIRAVAHSRSALPSEVFTSRRYWVLEGESGESDDGDEDDAVSMATEDFNEQQVQEAPGPTTQWRWWQCVPMVRGWIFNTNTVELYWDLPHADHSHLVEAYQIFVNDVCYHNNLVPPCHSVRITGFVGGVSYLICVVAMPTSASLLPQGSVKLRFDCPLVSDQGGPILSCEITDVPHQLPVVWSPLPQPGFKYQLYVNGVQHKEELLHTGDEKECRVIVTDCLPDRPLRVHLLALPSEPAKGTDQTGLLSNDLDISMPLYVDHMTVPKSGRLVGLPYLQVLEGSLSPPGPDARLLPEVSVDEENVSKEASESLESATVEDCALSPSSVSPAKINMDVNSAVSRNSDGFQSLPEDSGSQRGGEKSMGEVEADENEVGNKSPPSLPAAACNPPKSPSMASSSSHSTAEQAKGNGAGASDGAQGGESQDAGLETPSPAGEDASGVTSRMSSDEQPEDDSQEGEQKRMTPATSEATSSVPHANDAVDATLTAKGTGVPGGDRATGEQEVMIGPSNDTSVLQAHGDATATLPSTDVSHPEGSSAVCHEDISPVGENAREVEVGDVPPLLQRSHEKEERGLAAGAEEELTPLKDTSQQQLTGNPPHQGEFKSQDRADESLLSRQPDETNVPSANPDPQASNMDDSVHRAPDTAPDKDSGVLPTAGEDAAPYGQTTRDEDVTASTSVMPPGDRSNVEVPEEEQGVTQPGEVVNNAADEDLPAPPAYGDAINLPTTPVFAAGMPGERDDHDGETSNQNPAPGKIRDKVPSNDAAHHNGIKNSVAPEISDGQQDGTQPLEMDNDADDEDIPVPPAYDDACDLPTAPAPAPHAGMPSERGDQDGETSSQNPTPVKSGDTVPSTFTSLHNGVNESVASGDQPPQDEPVGEDLLARSASSSLLPESVAMTTASVDSEQVKSDQEQEILLNGQDRPTEHHPATKPNIASLPLDSIKSDEHPDSGAPSIGLPTTSDGATCVAEGDASSKEEEDAEQDCKPDVGCSEKYEDDFEDESDDGEANKEPDAEQRVQHMPSLLSSEAMESEAKSGNPSEIANPLPRACMEEEDDKKGIEDDEDAEDQLRGDDIHEGEVSLAAQSPTQALHVSSPLHETLSSTPNAGALHDENCNLVNASPAHKGALSDSAQTSDKAQDRVVSQLNANATNGDGAVLAEAGCEADRAVVVSEVLGKGQIRYKEGLTPTLRSVRSTANHPELHIHWNHPDADTGVGQDKGSTRPHPRLHHYLVCVEGIDFINQDVNSHARHETSSHDGESSIKHYWNAGRGTQLVVNRGLCESSQYRVSVAAVFKHPDGKKKLSKSTSIWMAVTTGGHPVPPRLSLVSVGVQEATVSWEPGRCHEDIEVLGYTVLRNGKPLGKTVPYGITEKTIQDLKPGSKSTLSVATVTSIGGPRKCSNSITVVCPRVPDTPSIAIKQSSSLHSATITWQKQKAKHLAGYIIYTDRKQRAEIEMSDLDRQSQCQYVLEDLMEGRDISVYMKAYAGWKNLPPNHNSSRVLCCVMSGRSNTLSVTGKAPPSSPSTRLEGMHSGGVDIMWEGLEQDEGCHLTGFVVLQEGIPHGPLLDPHSTRCTVSPLKPGTTLSVQVMAVSHDLFEPGGDDLRQQYPTCEPGPSLKVAYTGLLAQPTKVWTELVTGHSMLVVWRRGKKPNKTHYTDPDSFMVRWWQTDHQEDTISSQETSDDNLPIEGLESGCSYTIIVEARKWSTYYDDEDEGILGDDELQSTYLVTAASDPITVQTARPPDPPSDLKVTTAGPKSVELRWKPAVEHGSEILGLKMYVTLVGKGESDASGETIYCVDLLPDATEATINDLVQGKEYTIHLVAVTDDFFDQLPDSHPLHKAHDLPRSWSEVSSEVSSQWLPYVSIQARTHANSPPSGLRCTDSGVDWLTVGWRPPAWGGYTLGSYMVEWEDVTPDGGETASEDSMEGSVEVGHTHSHAKLRSLTPGRSYEIQVKAYMKPDASSKSGTKQNGGRQVLMNVILESDPITVRLPCRIQAPNLRIAGFSSYHIDLRWTRPQLALKSDNKVSKAPSKLLRCTLLGYRLIVEGNTPIYLSHDTTRYTLTQVRGGRTVKVQLVAVTTNKKVMLRSERKMGAGTGGGGDHAQKTMASVLKSIGDNKDETKTRMLYITVPKTQSGAIISCTCTYHHLRKASGDSEEADTGHDPLGYINVQWSLLDCGSAEEQGILGYDVSWMCDADGKEQVASISEDCTSYQIPVTRLGCVYDIGIQPVKDEDIWQDLNSPTIQCEVPGPPDPPTLCCVSMTTTEFILEWAEPRTYGGVGLRGYQVYMNGKKIGHELSAGHYKAAVPCRPGRVYILGIAALSDDPKYADSAHDQDLQLCTPDEDPKAASQVVRVPLLETLSPSAPKRGGQRAHPRTSSGSKLVPEVIDLRPSLVGTYSIGITWDFLRPEIIEKVQRLQVTWSSVVKPKEVEALLSPTASRFTVKNCASGTNHFITVTGLDKEDRKMCRSKQLIVQTSSQLSPPQPYISSSSFKGCTVKWDKPKEYRGASLSGFRLRMNGQQTTTLPATATAFTYRHGKMGHDYSFSLQAVCSDPHLSSDFSDPVHATWPGVVVPDLVRTPSTRVNAINIGWSTPELVGGAKVRQYKVLCMEEQSGLNRHAHHAPLISSPALPPDAASTEFNGLIPHQIYTIYLDVYLAGLAKPVRSKALLAQVARRPTAPKLSMRVVGAEERKHLNVEACAMAHDRDRLLQELFDLEFDLQDNYLVDAQYQDDLLSRVAEISSLLADIETSLDHCLENLKKYTGTVSIALSWDLVSDDGDAMVSGYKVLVNGEQYGFVLHSQVCETIIKLNAYNGTHRISLVAVTDHPVGNSDQSNVVSVDTCPYRPFVSYCLNNIHKPGLRYPQQGCCTYQETLREETHPDFHLLPTLHQHLPKRRIPAPSVTVFDQDQGTYRLLMPTKLSNRKPHVVLFWTHWCLASQAIMNHFVQYAKKRSNKVVCMAMCCLSGEDTDFHRANMTKVLSSRGWGGGGAGGGALQHCCCCQELEEDGSKVVAGRSLNTSHSLVQHASEKKSSDALSAVSDNVPELFGVIAVPTVIVIHPEGYLGWKSCFAVTDQAGFMTSLDAGIIKMLRTNPANFSTLSLAEPPIPEADGPCQANQLPPAPGSQQKKRGMAWGREQVHHASDANGVGRAKLSVGVAKPRTPPITSPKLRHFVLKKKQRQAETEGKRLISIDTRPFSANVKASKGKARPNSSVTI